MSNRKLLVLVIVLVLLPAVFVWVGKFRPHPLSSEQKNSWWEVQVIDTMKYSRDPAGEKLNDPSFDSEIEIEISNIAKTGATHVAIATPYDENFYPFLQRWVSAARRNNLKVWFRGNFSNWEGWFGYERKMTFEEHIQKSVEFIKKHPELFEDGDSFTACPECENGAQGDPRQTGKVAEYRNFLINETNETAKAFKSINKNVSTNWLSMNGDVAKVVMDKETAQKVGGVIAIDHYVATPQKLIEDINGLSNQTGAKIFLGEFGAPIPDIHGEMTEDQQAQWLDQAFEELSKSSKVIGINYWTNKGGSTEIWKSDNSPKKAVEIIRKYYSPSKVSGFVDDGLGNGINGAEISLEGQRAYTKDGRFEALILIDSTLHVSKPGFKSQDVQVARGDRKQISLNITLIPDNPSLWYRVRAFFKSLV